MDVSVSQLFLILTIFIMLNSNNKKRGFMMRKDFKGNNKDNFTISLIKDDTQQSISLKVASIVLFRPENDNRTLISYYSDDKKEKILSVLVSEDVQTVLDLVNGTPPRELEIEWEKEIIKERQNIAKENLARLDESFGIETKLEMESYQLVQELNISARRRYQDDINQLTAYIQKSPVGRRAQQNFDKLQEEANWKNEGEDGIYRTKTLNWWASKNVKTALERKHHLEKALEQKKREAKEKRNTHETRLSSLDGVYKNMKSHFWYNINSTSLIEDEFQRLTKRVSEYRQSHGDRSKFVFVQQAGGAYENQIEIGKSCQEGLVPKIPQKILKQLKFGG